MTRKTPAALALAGLLLNAFTFTTQAQSESMPTYELKPFVIVAANVAGSGMEIPPEAMRSAKPVDLAAILSSELPAAALTRKGPLAGDVLLRGFSRDNVVITVDNNQTFCACPNRMDPPAFHVSSQQIAGVSIRTGPFSVEQGGTVGGAIAVRTVSPKPSSLIRLYGYLGSFGYLAAGITSGTPIGSNGSVLGGYYHQQGGIYEDGSGLPFTEIPAANYQQRYQDRTAFQVHTAEVKVARELRDGGRISASYSYQDASDVLYPGLRMDAPEDTMNRASVTFELPMDSQLADKLQASLAFSHVDHDMQDGFRNTLYNMGGAFVERGYFMRTTATSAFAAARLELRRNIDDQALLRYGFDLRRRLWDAGNIIGMQTNDMLPDTVSDTVGCWAVYERRVGSWAFETGARIDYARGKAREDISFLQGIRETESNRQSDFLPSLYGLISRELRPSLRAYAGLGMASRVPDPQERYMNLNRPMMNTDWVGNPDLSPVTSLEAQGGVHWMSGSFDAQFSAFHSWINDYIYLIRLEGGPGATSYDNINARLYGLSLDAGWNVSSSFRVEAGLAWQEGIKESRPAGATNDVLGEIPPLRARVAGFLSVGDFTARAEVQVQEELDRLDPDLNELPVDGWAVLNLAASYQISDALSISGGVDNLFDKTYAVANSFVRDPFRSGVIVNEPGRFLFLRAGLEF